MRHYNIYCIYDAKGSFLGEINYLWKKYIFGFKCSLCDITHNFLFKKSEWKRNIKNLKLETIHLDEQTSSLKKITNEKTPCVVLKNNNEYTILIRSEELDKMKGNVDSFFKVLKKRINLE